ncbi:PREDICTED: uncharacterized protein LOC105962752 [Erythranthe guttata]|uniref:uncharacterized protein LOC105962752 n=1 Tax=Erythranthe guttata TaxID=4155 RepID=UPI00064D8B58|nr:PREDICTED: uncharacterized protein LOC105962752 [Erythranthe guttata]|eukprot:XP_012842530.1 PREDICTED: uncharacterized protein LOC105962752 [Erythranthe guttata]
MGTPWLVGGDFNTILDASEKKGGLADISRMHDFQDFVMQAELLDAGFIGNPFTWSNNRSGLNRIWKRLDRVLINSDFQLLFPSLQVLHLERTMSDHAPLSVRFEQGQQMAGKGFTFQRMWVDHPTFQAMVSHAWSIPVHGSPFYVFQQKLIFVQKALQQWNWELVQYEDWELELLSSKARMAWDKSGDRNTALFHATIKDRRKRALIQVTCGDGSTSTQPQEIGALAQDFFSNLFKASEYELDENLFLGVQPVVTDVVNEAFCCLPDMEEILEAVKGLNPNSSPGRDGFTGHFYVACWDIIKVELSNFIIDFFRGGHILKEMNLTTLVLIPKIDNARTVGDYRPISLGNFSGKLLSKILATRLGKILPFLISEEQAGFVKDRNIMSHIVMAQELTRDINQKCKGGNVIFKLDMAKAYDRLEWRFLLRAMRAFGFSHASCDLIYRNICNIWYSFRINGEMVGNFKSSRGEISQYKVGHNELSVSHLLYADDILIFTNGGRHSVQRLMEIFHSYERSSGQLVNVTKSHLYVGKWAEVESSNIEQVTGICRKTLPLKYLGVPIYSGRTKAEFFEYLVTQIRGKLQGWKGKFLSFAGKITLLKAVLSSIPIYSLACSKVPISVITRLEQLMAAFLWSSGGASRTHWVKWKTICTPVEDGGLGIRPLNQVMWCLHGKLLWQVMQKKSLWAKFANAKYCDKRRNSSGQSTSPLWRSIYSHSDSLAECSKWNVGSGDIRFWADNWVGEVLVGPLPSDHTLTVATAMQHLSEYLKLIPPSLHESVRKVTLDPDQPDRLIFTLTQSGDFSTKEYWRHIRVLGRREAWTNRIWHQFLPHKTCGFMWKLIHHALPVDQRIISRGIPMVSRCVCCKNPHQEDVQHLFFQSEVAGQVWQHFSLLFHLPSQFVSAKHALVVWVPKPQIQSQYTMVRTSTVCHILRELWVARCKVVYDGGAMHRENIIRRVFSHIQHVVINHVPRQPSTKLQSLQLQAIGVCLVQPSYKRGKWFKWERPKGGTFKLNTDGSSTAEECTGGGIVRDSEGGIVASFSRYFGVGTNNFAEFSAVVHGLRLCKLLGLSQIIVESDSLLVINAIRTKHIAWELEYIFRQCLKEIEPSFSFQHVVRQKNTVADRLANWAYSHKSNQEYFSEMSLPREARAAYISDKLGVANFRP